MSLSEMESKSIGSENSTLEVIGKERGFEGEEFIVKHHPSGNISRIVDTFAEMFPMWVSRILITADTLEWALTSATAATGFAVSIIMSPAEAGIEKTLSPSQTPDGRPGVIIQIYHRTGHELKGQMITRLGQCVMTCPTTAAFDILEGAVKKLKVGKSLSLFGDGFQKKDNISGHVVWRIPVMEGEFLIESKFGVKRGVAGGNFLIFAKDKSAGLASAEAAVKAIKEKCDGVVLTFPGGICRSGSKVGSMKYKLPASTNHPFCPTLRGITPDSQIPEGVNSVYELVINGLDLESVKKAMAEGIKASVRIPGVVKITAANYGGKLGPYQANLKEMLQLEK
ncbi:MAG: formylmethanofuran--tetrahydromethanopterin N-formyltransferase [Candidatus Bathyarchaeia archaeon]